MSAPVPSFEWTIDPVAFHIPKGPLLLVVGGIAAIMLISGLVKKQGDVAVFGLFMGGIMMIASQFLPEEVPIRYYSLLFVGVFLGGYALLNWQILRGGGPEEAAGDFIVYGVLGVLVGSRLGHVIFYDFDKFLDDPVWLFQIWTGGLASHGAVMGLIFAMYLFTKRRGVPFLEGADRFAFSAALGATLVRLGNFFNHEIVGRVVEDQSWGVRFMQFREDAARGYPLRYPTQLFEVALGLTVMASLFAADRLLGKEKRPRGALISVFFVVYFAGRFSVEFFKEYQTLESTSTLTMGQYLSIPAFLLGVFGLVWSLKARLPAGWHQNDQAEDEEQEGDADSAPGRLYDEDVEAELAGSGAHTNDDEDDESPSEADEGSDKAASSGSEEAEETESGSRATDSAEPESEKKG